MGKEMIMDSVLLCAIGCVLPLAILVVIGAATGTLLRRRSMMYPEFDGEYLGS